MLGILYPEWYIINPLVCPIITQKFKIGHKGLDLINKNCQGNLSVFSVQSGTVDFVGWGENCGNRIVIDHGNEFLSTYSHLKKSIVKMGDNIILGQEIGIMGTTGRSSGIHLHFEVIYQGEYLNPEIYLYR